MCAKNKSTKIIFGSSSLAQTFLTGKRRTQTALIQLQQFFFRLCLTELIETMIKLQFVPVPFADFEAGRDRTDSHSRACVLMFLQPEKSDDTLI